MNFTYGLLLVAFFSDASRSRRCDIDAFAKKVRSFAQSARQINPTLNWPTLHWLGGSNLAFATRWPSIYSALEADMLTYARDDIGLATRQAIASGNVSPLEALERIEVQHEFVVHQFERWSQNVGFKDMRRGESLDAHTARLKEVFHNLYVKNTLDPPSLNEGQKHFPWFIELHSQKFAALKERLRVAGSNASPKDIDEIVSYAARIPSLMAEAHAAMLLPNIRYTSVHAHDLRDRGLLKSELTKQEGMQEIDLIGEDSKGFTFYEVKRYQGNRVGEEKHFAETIDQLTRHKQLASKMRLRTTVKLMSYTGFTAAARKIFEEMGVELIGPPE